MREIPLTQSKVAIVDNEDYEELNKHRWYAWKTNGDHRAIYAGRGVYRGRGKRELMHRRLMNAPDNMQVDHINGNGLDNRKDNLRLCTNRQNGRNRGVQKNNKSGFKGVRWSKTKNKYEAQITANGEQMYLGVFDDKIEAAIAYNKKAIELHGEFAKLNIIPKHKPKE